MFRWFIFSVLHFKKCVCSPEETPCFAKAALTLSSFSFDLRWLFNHTVAVLYLNWSIRAVSAVTPDQGTSLCYSFPSDTANQQCGGWLNSLSSVRPVYARACRCVVTEASLLKLSKLIYTQSIHILSSMLNKALPSALSVLAVYFKYVYVIP